jgi:hypothetical protein
MIVVKVKIVNSIHSSRESLRCSVSRVSNQIRHALTDAVEATELVSLTQMLNTQCLKAVVEYALAQILKVVLVRFNFELKVTLQNHINNG